MEIDPFTFGAQVVNFLILVFLLKKFLFDRVSKVMDERAKRTTAALAEAEAAKREAERLSASCVTRKAEIEASREGIVGEAEARAEVEGRRILETARAAGLEEREAWRADLAARREAFATAFRKRSGEWLGRLARRAMADLADEGFEDRMLTVFLEGLEAVDEAALEGLRSALRGGDIVLVMRSSFEIGAEDRRKIEASLGRKLGRAVAPVYETAVDAGAGLVLEGGGFRLGWTVEDYLGEIDERILAAFDEEGGHDRTR
jgi:F-type H+-transporting ATPase subunit b